MKKRIEYCEEQRWKAWWMWAWIIVVLLPFLMLFTRQIVLGRSFGDTPVPDGVLIAAMLILLLVSAMLLFSKLSTVINEEGIYFRYLPYQFKYKFVPWAEVEDIRICTFSPMWEFGGYGIRRQMGTRFTKKKTGYIVSGKYGFELRLTSGKYILIGTKRPGEIKEIINSIQK